MEVQFPQDEVDIEFEMQLRYGKGREGHIDTAKDLYLLVALQERDRLVGEIARKHLGSPKTQDLSEITNAFIIHEVSLYDAI